MSFSNLSVLALVAAGLLIFAGCSRSHGQGSSQSQPSSGAATATAEMTIASPSIEPNGAIPRQFTADGADVSPELKISGVPQGTKELVLIVEDPDAPMPEKPRMVWDHWLLYKIPGGTTDLPEGLSAARKKVHPKDLVEGKNSWGNQGYEGPEPPPTSKPHRYFFKVYALSVPLDAKPGLTKKELVEAMQGKIIAQAQLIGMYGRGK